MCTGVGIAIGFVYGFIAGPVGRGWVDSIAMATAFWAGVGALTGLVLWLVFDGVTILW